MRRLLTPEEVAEETKLCVATIRRKCQTGELPASRPLRWDDVRERSTARAFELVFPTSRGGEWTPTEWGNWRARIWHGTKRNPGVAPPGTRPYDLRHTFVSVLLRDPGYSRVEVAAQAGHSLQVQDRTYAHVIAELRGEGSADEAIRRARAGLLGQGTAEATGQMR